LKSMLNRESLDQVESRLELSGRAKYFQALLPSRKVRPK
jgi:hypothetical protein